MESMGVEGILKDDATSTYELSVPTNFQHWYKMPNMYLTNLVFSPFGSGSVRDSWESEGNDIRNRRPVYISLKPKYERECDTMISEDYDIL